MRVPLLDLKAQFRAIETDIRKALDGVLESQHFILGPEVEALEREIAVYCGCAHGIGVSSGTDALLVALMALRIGRGDEVITSPYSFFSTAGTIARVGAKPIFVDIELDTYNLNSALLEKAITGRTKAIVPVHLYGQMADMGPILKVAKGHEIPVIEDAAQAIGAEYRGGRAGSFGDLGCFSFFPSKNLGAFGDGGMVVSNDEQLADRVRLLRNHGFRPKYYNREVGGNFRLDALQAAVLRVKLPCLDKWSAHRQRNADRYQRLFAERGLVEERLVSELSAPATGVRLPQTVDGHSHVYNQFIVRCAHRNELRQYLADREISTEIYYPVPLHLQVCFAELGGRKGQFPTSEAAADQTLALPIYAELSEEQQTFVVDAIADFYKSLQD